MKFAYQDLLNFLSEKPSLETLSSRLFQLGHEHEICDEIFDIEFTPNRGDCLSLNGLSRDLNIFFGNSLPYKIFQKDIEPLDFDFRNLSTDACPRVSFLEIEIDEHISAYKPYLENYFSKLGNNKVNFFTDISNYVSYELGQPTHCFDASSISNQLTFENRTCEEDFRTLHGSDIKLNGKNCIFSLNNEIISLAGVMGGASTACSKKTKKALIECAFFSPEAIIGKSIKYNLISDAAHKFERGVDIQLQETVLRRFIEIVNDHVEIKSIKIKQFDESKDKKLSIPINIDRINKILGTNLKEKDYLVYLSKLGFDIKDEIIVPSHRHDISSQNDLAEEIARVIGYNNIQSKPLKIINKTRKNLNDLNEIKFFLMENGFSETINFPFTSSSEKKSILIDNPLDSNKNHLRISLRDSLLDNLLYNERRQKDSIKLFEISDIYSKSDQINQETKLGIIISGRRGHNYKDFSLPLDHKYLEQLLNKDTNDSTFEIKEIPRTEVKSKKKEKIFYTEILINKIPEDLYKSHSRTRQINFIKYKSVSEFPTSTRDFSFSIKDPKKYSSVINHLLDLNDENLKDSFIFDFYKNDKLNEIKVGIRLVFQSHHKTLSDQEILNSVNSLLRPIIELDDVSIPGFE